MGAPDPAETAARCERALRALLRERALRPPLPAAEPNVLRLILSRAAAGAAHVIDFGCGSGRYLLALRDRAAVAAGYDVCAAALERFRQARGPARARRRHLHALGPDPGDLDRHLRAARRRRTWCSASSGCCRTSRAPGARRRPLRRHGGAAQAGLRAADPVGAEPPPPVPVRAAGAGAGGGEIRYVRRLRGHVAGAVLQALRPRQPAGGARGGRPACWSARGGEPGARGAGRQLADRCAASTGSPRRCCRPALGYGLLAVARPGRGRDALRRGCARPGGRRWRWRRPAGAGDGRADGAHPAARAADRRGEGRLSALGHGGAGRAASSGWSRTWRATWRTGSGVALELVPVTAAQPAAAARAGAGGPRHRHARRHRRAAGDVGPGAAALLRQRREPAGARRTRRSATGASCAAGRSA